MEETKLDTKQIEQVTQPETAHLADNSAEETPQQIDWKRFKEARKLERQQKEEAERSAARTAKENEALKAVVDALVNKPNQASTSNEEESDDDRIQKRIDAALANERRRVEEERRQREHAEFPQRLVAAHPDFDSVCTAENIDYLEYHKPAIAKAFKAAPDGFDKWSGVYQAIKEFVPNHSSTKDQKKAERNLGKPQAMSQAGVTQTGDTAPQMLDDRRKQDNWRRMQLRMKNIS